MNIPQGEHTAHLVRVTKRGRTCTVAKVVPASGTGEWVLAAVYRDPARRVPSVASMPVAVLQHALRLGCRRWVVRIDQTGEAYSLDIEDVLREGWRQASDGIMELFVPLDRFEHIAWPDWPYIPPDGPAVVLGPDCDRRPSEGRQLRLWGEGGEGRS